METMMEPGKPVQTRKGQLGARLCSQVRQWHGWLGIAMSLLIGVVCLSGIYLNHKDLLDTWMRPRTAHASVLQYASVWDKLVSSDARVAPEQTKFSGSLSTSTSARALEGMLGMSLREAQSRWGQRELEKVELKTEGGTLVCKLTSKNKEQLVLNASSGAVVGNSDTKKGGKTEKGGKPEKREDFGKWLKNLHTGKIGGMTGKLVVDFTSISILVLTFSGVYLWAWPRIRRRLKIVNT